MPTLNSFLSSPFKMISSLQLALPQLVTLSTDITEEHEVPTQGFPTPPQCPPMIPMYSKSLPQAKKRFFADH